MSKTAEQRMNDEYIAALRDNANQRLGGVDYLAVSKAMAAKLRDAYAECERFRAALEQYADEQNWGVVEDSSAWREGRGPELARRALAGESITENKEDR